MDVVGSEIGLKMRSAIKAKLTELGCYVDDELPDYVMVMVANKRTRAQMEDDLQLFLGDNTELFVNWLHQVLKKLQEVTITAPLKADAERNKERSASKERKDKKDKDKSKKSDSSKKSKKKDKSRRKEEKKSHKSKKKSKHHDMIRPNIPPLLMNMEKVSEPSITDVFAGQILKNHGVLLESYKEDPKTVFEELKRPIIPIIDPATISQPDTTSESSGSVNENNRNTPVKQVKDEHIKEINQIEAKIQGLKQKLTEQLDSMSDDEDFLTIRTEAEELMNDFAEEVLQEVPPPPAPASASALVPASDPVPVPAPAPAPAPVPVPTPITPPLQPKKPQTQPLPPVIEKPKEKEPEMLPQIELNLPKRTIRERLGARASVKPQEVKELETPKKKESPERFTPEKEPNFRPHQKSTKNRVGCQSESQRKTSVSQDNSDKCESSSKRLTSKVSVLEGRSGRSTCASVVRVRPRPRVSAPCSSLLLRAVADAHKSLLNIPPKIESEPHKIKRALVLPMRRCMDAQKIVIEVPGAIDAQSDSQGDTLSLGDVDSEGDDKSSKVASDITDKEDFAPHKITKVIKNTEYVPESETIQQDDMLVDKIIIHNTKVAKDKDTQFIVTMDGYHPNAFLAKKLLTEGLLDEDAVKEKLKEIQTKTKVTTETKETVEKLEKDVTSSIPKKRLSNTSDESDTQVIIKKDEEKHIERDDNTKSTESIIEKITEDVDKETPPAKKRRASPIVFDVGKRQKEIVRERTISTSSDSHVILSTTSTSHKYDALPSLSQAERKLLWCRSFPLCRYGSSCAFAHPRCKFAAACTRRGCVYSHSPNALPGPSATSPVVASHVVPAANYKTISTAGLPSVCKFYPNCVNPACHFYHPKPCRYGKACVNKVECNFYHHDFPSTKWKYSI